MLLPDVESAIFKSQGFRQSKPLVEQGAADSEGRGLVGLIILRRGDLSDTPRILNPKGSLGLLSLPSSQIHLFLKPQESKAALGQNLCGVFPLQKLAQNSACSGKGQVHGFRTQPRLSRLQLASVTPRSSSFPLSTATPKLPALGLYAR